MRNGVFLVLCICTSAVLFQILRFFGFSFEAILLCTAILCYFQLYLSIRYNFRSSLDYKAIPEKGYEKRLELLRLNEHIFNRYGFEKVDEFYLQLSNDVVAFCYKSNEHQIVLVDYHFGNFNYFDLVSKFEVEQTLTTSSAENAGLIPRPAENMLQIFLGLNFEQMISKHLHTIAFLKPKGYVSENINYVEFRAWFLGEYKKVGKIINNPISPMKIVYWSLTNNKTKYIKSIQEQFLSKDLQLPKY